MKKKLSNRINSLIIAISLILAFIFFILILNINRFSYDRELSQVNYFLDTLLINKRETISRAVSSNERETLSDILYQFTENEYIVAGTIYLPDGETLAHVGQSFEKADSKELSSLRRSSRFIRESEVEKNLAVYTSGIYTEDEEYGYIRIYYDTSSIVENNQNMSFWILMLLTVKTITLILLLNGTLKNIVVNPILRLEKDMQKVSTGNFDMNISEFQIYEIDQMKNTFNRMTKSLKETQDNLEELVETRTKELTESRKMFEVVIDTMPTPVFYKDKDGRYTGCNSSYAKLLGKTKEEIVGKTIFEIMDREFAEPIYEQENNMLKSPDSKSYEGTFKTVSGDLEVIVNKATIVSETGEVEGLVAVMSDITDRKEMVEEIKYSAKFQELIAEISSEFLIVNRENIDQKIMKMLRLVGEFFCVDRAYLYQQIDRDTYHNTHEWSRKGIKPSVKTDMVPDIYPWIKQKIKQKKPFWIDSVDELSDALDSQISVFKKYNIASLLSIPIVVEGNMRGFLGLSMVEYGRKWKEKEVSLLKLISNVLTDGLEKKKIQDKLEDSNKELMRLSTTDKLTQLYNRLKIDEVLETEINQVKRYKVKLSLIIFDIDCFKRINDTFGHQEGDKVLVDLASILKRNLRKTDTLGRWGGEEFIVICPETSLEGALVAAEKIRTAIKRYDFTVGDVTCSFGVTESNENDSVSSIVARADEALYTAKNSGRDRVEYK